MESGDTMLPFRELTLADKPLLDAALTRHPFQNSEMTFASLWMWRDVWMCGIHISDQAIIIREHQPLSEDPSYILPILTDQPLPPLLEMVTKDFYERCLPFSMRSVDEAYRQRLESECPGWFTFEPDVNFYDYVYNTSDLIELAGRKYHGKRNHITKFTSLYTGEYREMTSADTPECMELYDRWAHERGDQEQLVLERRVIYDALIHLSELGMRCGAILIDGKVEACSLGEIVRDTAIIHTEKANIAFEGLYAYVNQQFVRNAFSHTRFVNREEDMGIDGLRRAKASYHPCARVVKYIARLRERP